MFWADKVAPFPVTHGTGLPGQISGAGCLRPCHCFAGCSHLSALRSPQLQPDRLSRTATAAARKVGTEYAITHARKA
jgi:hypothetical protein